MDWFDPYSKVGGGISLGMKVFDDGYAEAYILLKWRISSPHSDSVLSIRLCVLIIITKQV
jgi:hypothetical protein